MKTSHLTSLFFATSTLAWAVPSEINYQGRLTDSNGNAVTGDVSMSLKMYDAATGGNELYSEDIGTVTLGENGIYSFQFGADGQSTVAASETIAIADGSSTNYSRTLPSTLLDGTLVVADGTNSWNIVDGNPGATAIATAQTTNGFVIGVTMTSGGEGYTNPPAVAIEGDGTGATATAVVENGAVTAINIVATGSGYTNATITIAPPPTPYVVTYEGGTVNVAYETAPDAGTEIVVTYDINEESIAGALSGASSHWLELSIDAVAQSPRERVLSVPFASVAQRAQVAERAIKLNDEGEHSAVLEEVYRNRIEGRLRGFPFGIPPNFGTNTVAHRYAGGFGFIKYAPYRKAIKSVQCDLKNEPGDYASPFSFTIVAHGIDGGTVFNSGEILVDGSLIIELPLDLDLDFSRYSYSLSFDNSVVRDSITNAYNYTYINSIVLTYSE